MTRRHTPHPFALAAILTLLAGPACDREPSNQKATSQPPRPSEDESAESAPTEQDPNPGATRRPTATPAEPDADADQSAKPDTDTNQTAKQDDVPPEFTFEGGPYAEEWHRDRLLARESTEFPLRASPDPEANVVDRLPVEKGDEITRPDDSRMMVDARKREAPTSFQLQASAHRAGPEPDRNVQVEQGDPVAIYVEYIGEGSYYFYMWHDGIRYFEQPRDLTVDKYPFDLFGLSDNPHFTLLDEEGTTWWAEVSGPDRTGWLRIDPAKIETDVESTGPPGP
jgi:hypothetical protein